MKIPFTLILFCCCIQICAQNIIITSVPFLEVNPDAQTKGIADIGVVSSTYQIQSFLQNPALLTQSHEGVATQINYMPWLRALGIDWKFIEGAATANFGKQAIALNYKYFSLGELDFIDENGERQTAISRELALSGHYAYQLSERFSLGIGLKYFSSHLADDLLIGTTRILPAIGMAVDIGALYAVRQKTQKGRGINYQVGMGITNVGPRVSYVSNQLGNYIPTMFKLGAMIGFEVNKNEAFKIEYNFRYQLQKFLVPTPSFTDVDNNGIMDFREQGLARAILTSFADAPGGSQEEWQEVMHQFGGEIWLTLKEDFQIGLRSGVFYEHENKGARNYLSTGLSFGINGFFGHFAFVKSMSGLSRALDNTLMFGVGYHLKLNNYWRNTN